MKDEKISIFQTVAIYILVSIVPVVRYFPIIMTGSAGKAAWLAAILSIIPNILLVFALNALMNNLKTKDGNKVETLSDVFDTVYGRTMGSIITIIYLLWTIIFASVELRLFGERLISTTYTYAPIVFFIITMLLLVFFVVRGKISSLGRFAEIFLELFAIIIVFVVLTSYSNFDFANFWPVTTYDAKGIAIGVLKGTDIFNMFTFAMFLGNKISDKENIKKTGIFAAITTGIIGLIGIIITLGTFGEDLLPTLSQPFFMALKVINLFGVLERIEAVFITFWVVADFVLIAYNVLIASNICKQKFKISKRKLAVTPIILIMFVLATIIANNYFALQVIFINYMANIVLILGLVVPFVTFGIAKARKML